MQPSNPLFSVSQFTTWKQTFEEDIELYRRLGIEGIEICQRKMSAQRDKALQQLQSVAEAGLRVTSVQPRLHALFPDSMCAQPLDPIERMGQFRQTIDLFAEAFPGQNLPLVTLAGIAPNGNFRQGQQTALRLYPDLADYAAQRQVRIMLEPLNPIFMQTDSFVCSLDHAIELVTKINRPNFGITLDVWHVWRDSHLIQKLEKIGERIFAVHISDWPNDEPRCQGDRLLPGDGRIDLPAIFGALERGGYGGAYCLEIFSAEDLADSIWNQDAASVLQRARAAFYQAWELRK